MKVRGGYGKQIVVTVSQQLTPELDAGRSRVFTRILRLVGRMTDERILVTVSRELTVALGRALSLRSLNRQPIVSTPSTQSCQSQS